MKQRNTIQVKSLSKSFGGVRAVNNVSFDLGKGNVLGIIGPNGSGKTTLVNLLTGFVKKDSGEVFFNGRDITKRPAYKIADMGLVRTFQNIRPFHSMPVFKNLIPTLFSARRRRTSEGHLGDRDAVALDLLEEVGFHRGADTVYQTASSLPLGYLKRLELARCMAMNPLAIICDEIFSGLSTAEIAGLIPLIEKLRDEGITLIMIEHRLRELFMVANRVLVLNFGVKIAEGAPGSVMKQKEVRDAYLGEETEAE
jgi:ABC-type branched-subunit amino acid transport system ATPase component